MIMFDTGCGGGECYAKGGIPGHTDGTREIEEIYESKLFHFESSWRMNELMGGAVAIKGGEPVPKPVRRRRRLGP